MLLKNDGVLPLSRDIEDASRSIGPNADELMSLLGNYYGTPAAPVTVLAGHPRAAGPATQGALRARRRPRRRPAGSARAAADRRRSTCGRQPGSTEHGLKGEYFRGRDLAGRAGADAHRCRASTFRWDRGSPTTIWSRAASCPRDRALGNDDFSRALDRPAAAAGVRRYELDGDRRRWLPPVRRRHARDRRLDDRRRARARAARASTSRPARPTT